ncbi:putative primary ciliary dyskinesia protein 1-like [Apostichopus japonicus]|uniref:Putative primary ciliary dyskinesia protein 1-like n=1 Tax=Stichopus japonicus TaxID=307972 RepID=A0A2G8L9V6_STIJA|nr:putative primary ciliary dyskinesia protein 1-like [Apostichopus japonicus]
MALERPISQQGDFLSHSHKLVRKHIIVPEKLVADEDKKVIPNHILDTKLFHKLSSNAIIQAVPAAVHFAGFEPGKLFKQTLRFVNLSSECQQMHVIPPSSRYFKAWYKKRERLVPGMALEVSVEFTPDEWRYYYDCIRIHCKDAENLIVPLHGYPVMDVSDFPSVYSFPQTPVSQSITKEIPLRCKAPVDFEFYISFPQPNPSFTVEPLTGVIPAHGQTALQITFQPTEFSTAVMKIQLNISQFNSKPLVCVITGHSTPGLEKKEVSSVLSSEFDCQLDPHSISPLGVSRKKRNKKSKARQPAKDTDALEKDGIRFPSNLDAQHSVNSVLIQQAGKMSVKELREAILYKRETVVNRYQLKEAEFDQEVKEDLQAERRNELRWQVHLGRDQISETDREDILAYRAEALSEYHYNRGDPISGIEYSRSADSCIQRRTLRNVTDKPAHMPQFDLLNNDPWATRHRAIGRFRRAVNKVILRSRADKKVPFLQKLVVGYKLGKAGKEFSTTFGEDFKIAKYSDLTLHVVAQNILPHAFPTYIAPYHKDDMAPDALGIVPSKGVSLDIKRQVPYFNLKVPQQYMLMGYKCHCARDAGSGYVPPQLVRALRHGAEDELINIQAPDGAWTQQVEEIIEDVNKDQEDDDDVVELRDSGQWDLVPPPALFKPTEYPPLHIFNPAPGLQVFLPPMPYAETDPDFHLNPLPCYTHRNPTNKHGSTLKNFLDREEVIKGVMQWKKFPSQGLVSLANTPTLMNVWVPRCDSECDEDTEEMVLLSPAMVNAEFPLIDSPHTPEATHQQTISEEFPLGTKLPAHNNPVSSSGPVPREKREKELEIFLQKRNNKLGERIQGKIEHMNSLLNNKELMLD